MAKIRYPTTPAVRVLKEHGVSFTQHLYCYEDRGGAGAGARQLGLDEHCVIKTLVMEDDQHAPLVVLMHGDRQVSTKELARTLGVRSIAPCTPELANRHSGYLVGGTSPFGTRRSMPVFVEESVLDLPKIYLNGGKRGFLVGIDPQDLVRILGPTAVRVAV